MVPRTCVRAGSCSGNRGRVPEIISAVPAETEAGELLCRPSDAKAAGADQW